jgi:excisionase family DNA binding protein
MRTDRKQRSTPLLSVEEAAELLGQSRSSLYRAIERGDVPFPVFSLNGRYRIARRSVELVIAGELGAGSGLAKTTGDDDGASTPESGGRSGGRGYRPLSADPRLRRCARRLGGPPR